MQAAVCNNYGKLQITFNNFRIIWKKNLPITKSAKHKQQATVTNMFSKASSSKLVSIALFVIFLKQLDFNMVLYMLFIFMSQSWGM